MLMDEEVRRAKRLKFNPRGVHLLRARQYLERV